MSVEQVTSPVPKAVGAGDSEVDVEKDGVPSAEKVEDLVLEPSATEDLVWGVQQVFTWKTFVGSFLCQSLTHAVGWAFLVKMNLGAPETKMLFKVLAATFIGFSNFCYTFPIMWYLKIMHGGWPELVTYAFDVVAFLIGFLEVMLMNRSQFGLLFLFAVCLPITILWPGRRRWFVMQWSILRIVCQTLGTVALQNLPKIQAALPAAAAPFVFPVGSMVYKAICVPALFMLWRLGRRDSSPMFPLLLILGQIKYSSEALFVSGIVISFALNGESATATSILAIVYHVVLGCAGRFGFADVLKFQLGQCFGMKRRKSYLTEYVHRVSATQSCFMWYGYLYLASMALLLHLLECAHVAPWLYNPSLWMVIGICLLAGLVGEIFVAAGVSKLRVKAAMPQMRFGGILLNMHKADTNANVGMHSPEWKDERARQRKKETAIRKDSQEMEDFHCIGWQLMGLLLALDTSTAFLSSSVAAMLGAGMQRALQAAAA